MAQDRNQRPGPKSPTLPHRAWGTRNGVLCGDVPRWYHAVTHGRKAHHHRHAKPGPPAVGKGSRSASCGRSRGCADQSRSSSARRHMSLKNETMAVRFFRLLAYVGIGLVLATLLFVAGWYGASKGINGPPVRWIGLVCITPIVFWYPAREYRRYWHRLAFWLTLASMVTLHIIGFAALLTRFPGWRLLWFVPTTLIEGWAVILVLDATLRFGHGRRGNHLPQSHP